MKHSGLKILTIVVISVVLVILLTNKKGNIVEDKQTDPNNLNQAAVNQFHDDIREVSARLMETDKKVKLLIEQNQTLALKNQELMTAKQDGPAFPQVETPNTYFESTLKSIQTEIARLKRGAENSIQPPESAKTYPIGEHQTNQVVVVSPIKDLDAILFNRKQNAKEKEYWEKLTPKTEPLSAPSLPSERSDKDNVEPYYTIPAGSDLDNTKLLTALIGEVPSEGKLMQPLFPFSALISPGDLMASNGVYLPSDIAGMKVNGYAIGVGSFLDKISCVRAYVTSILFTFQDGHFVVVGQESMKNSTELVNNESLGYLTTPYGSPCIHGEYHTNAPQVLGAMLAAGGVQGAGRLLSLWQLSYLASPLGVGAIPNGSLGTYAAGDVAANGSVKVADWLEKRLQGSFDMVFVPASFRCGRGYCPTQLSLHLTQSIPIDKQLNGRVIDYGQANTRPRDFSLR